MGLLCSTYSGIKLQQLIIFAHLEKVNKGSRVYIYRGTDSNSRLITRTHITHAFELLLVRGRVQALHEEQSR